MARIRFKNRNHRTKNSKSKSSNKLFLNLIQLLSNTLKGSPLAFLMGLTPWNQYMPFGGLFDLSYSMTTHLNGSGLKSELHWDMRQRNPMLGWTESRELLAFVSISYFPTSSMNMWISLCSEISYILSLHFWRRMLCLLQVEWSLNRENLSLLSIFNPKTSRKKFSCLLFWN